MLRFANSYKSLKAELTDVGNIRIFDKEGTMFVVKPSRIDTEKVAEKGEDLAKSILVMIANHGIGGAIKRTNAIVGPRLAQVLEHYVDDMAEDGREEPGSVLESKDNDMQQDRESSPGSVTDGGEETDTNDPHEHLSHGLILKELGHEGTEDGEENTCHYSKVKQHKAHPKTKALAPAGCLHCPWHRDIEH